MPVGIQKMATLEDVQRHASEARSLMLEIKGLEQRLEEAKAKLDAIQSGTLPDLMDRLKIDHIGVPSSGNYPGMDFQLRNYYRASISVKWPDDRQKAAFDLLEKLNAGSLIKTEVSAAFPKGKLAAAKKAFSALKKFNVPVDLSRSVHHGTLTTWVKEKYERGQRLSDAQLETIGASVGRICRPIDRKDEPS
jgi:hypothetical protein